MSRKTSVFRKKPKSRKTTNKNQKTKKKYLGGRAEHQMFNFIKSGCIDGRPVGMRFRGSKLRYDETKMGPHGSPVSLYKAFLFTADVSYDKVDNVLLLNNINIPPLNKKEVRNSNAQVLDNEPDIDVRDVFDEIVRPLDYNETTKTAVIRYPRLWKPRTSQASSDFLEYLFVSKTKPAVQIISRRPPVVTPSIDNPEPDSVVTNSMHEYL